MNFIDTDLRRKRAPWEITSSAMAAWTPDESKINAPFACIFRVYETHLVKGVGCFSAPSYISAIFLCPIDRSLLRGEETVMG